jgi:tRNA G18 (ribose-2'-O)-methylase SpoU
MRKAEDSLNVGSAAAIAFYALTVTGTSSTTSATK